MRYKALLYQKVGGVSTISLNLPAEDNTINRRLAEELSDICADINSNEDVRAVIITGVGDKAFCAGIDPKELASVDSKGEVMLLSVAAPVASLAVPVIAAINGDALGLGLELALACDLRIAAETTRFALTHIVSGTVPWDGATQRLPRLVGKVKAMEMLLTGRSVDAREAFQIGLVTKVVPHEQLLPVAMEMAQAIASKAPYAVKYAKEAICKGLDLTLEQGLRLEADLYLLLHTTEDRTEGIRAFLEKRPPQFKGK